MMTAEPVDAYWEDKVAPDEEIRATCRFDYFGYSHSSGTITLTQKPNDNLTMIGEFSGLGLGKHALKIHEFGDLEHGCESTGDVYNPFGMKQGHSHFDINDRRVGDCE